MIELTIFFMFLFIFGCIKAHQYFTYYNDKFNVFKTYKSDGKLPVCKEYDPHERESELFFASKHKDNIEELL